MILADMVIKLGITVSATRVRGILLCSQISKLHDKLWQKKCGDANMTLHSPFLIMLSHYLCRNALTALHSFNWQHIWASSVWSHPCLSCNSFILNHSQVMCSIRNIARAREYRSFAHQNQVPLKSYVPHTQSSLIRGQLHMTIPCIWPEAPLNIPPFPQKNYLRVRLNNTFKAFPHLRWPFFY